MEDSLLLSSMSPKVSKDTNKPGIKRQARKLALKKQIRHSSVYSKPPKYSNIILIDDDSSETVTSSSMTPEKKFNQTPIVISDTDDDSDEIGLTKLPSKNCSRSSVNKLQNKNMQIENWIKRVNAENKINDDTLNGSEANESDVVVSTHISNDKDSSLVESLASIIEDSFVGADNKQEVDSIKGPTSKEVDSEDNTKKSFTLDSCSEKDSYVESMLDELYGKEWRLNENNVFTKSEPRKRNKIVSKNLPQTEKKPPRPYKDGLRRKLLFNSINSPDEKADNFKDTFKEQLHTTCTTGIENKPLQAGNGLPIKADTDLENNTSVDLSENQKQSDIINDQKDFDQYFNDYFNSLSLEERIKDRIELSRNSPSVFDNNERPLSSNNILLNELKVNVKDNGTTDKSSVQGGKPRRKKKTITNILNTNNEVTNPAKSIHKRVVELKNMSKDSFKQSANSVTYSFLASLSGNIPVSKSDPSALIYRNNFKHHREKLAEKLFKLYNETVFDKAIPEDTPIVWNTRMRGSAGFCYCKRAIKGTEIKSRSVRIALSTKVLDSADRLRDTLIHEMCHAATWMVNHISDGHGPHWKAWTAKAMNTYPELPPIKRCHDYEINTKYTYRCTECGYSFGRHTKSLNMDKKRCGYCLGKFEILLNKTTKTGRTEVVPTTPKKEATGFALFVKENYAQVKTPQLNHGDVMRILGQNFQACKITNM